MNQTTSDINVDLADECKRLRARVNQLEGILEHSESENDALKARFLKVEKSVARSYHNVGQQIKELNAIAERLKNELALMRGVFGNDKGK